MFIIFRFSKLKFYRLYSYTKFLAFSYIFSVYLIRKDTPPISPNTPPIKAEIDYSHCSFKILSVTNPVLLFYRITLSLRFPVVESSFWVTVDPCCSFWVTLKWYPGLSLVHSARSVLNKDGVSVTIISVGVAPLKNS